MSTPDKRQEEILALLMEQEKCSVGVLSSTLDVSEVTIRKDLTTLEEQGDIVRTRGGARLHPAHMFGSLLHRHARSQPQQKHRIAQLAVSLIEPHQTILIGAGTTTEWLARELGSRGPLTVVTNALNVALACSHHDMVEVHVLGGLLRPRSSALVGPQAEAMLREVACDIAFLGTDGLDVQLGLTSADLLEASLCRAMIDVAAQVVLLADATKLDKVSYRRIAGLDAIDLLITDECVDDEVLKQLRNHIPVQIARPEEG